MKRMLPFAMVLALSACSDTPAEIQAKARSAYAAHDYRAARIHTAAMLDAEPNNREMLLLQARSMIALGDGEGGGAALERLVGLTPPKGELAELSAEAALLRKVPDVALAFLDGATGAETERLRALAAIQKRDMPAAAEHFAKAVAAGGNTRTFADYARFRLITGDVSGAEEMADKAKAAAPDGIDTLLVVSQLALRRGDLKLALDTYQRAIKLYPSSLAALTGKAAALGDLGRYDEMQPIVDQAAAFAPDDLTVMYLRARLGMARKDWGSVRSAVQPFETTLPQQHPARLLYGEALLRLGQGELALAQLGPILRSQPGNRMARLLVAESELAGGDAETTLETLAPLIDLPTARVEELQLAAKAAKAAGDPQAARLAERARFPAPQSLVADMAEGDAAIRVQDWAKAIAAYDRVLAKTDGRNAMVLNNMAYSQLMVGNLDKAQGFATRALEEAPDNASVLDTAGWIGLKLGKNPAESKRLLRRAAEKAPNNRSIQAHLAEAERAPG